MNSRIDFSLLAKELADSLLPVCSSVNGSSGGLAGAQRACFLSKKSVFLGAPNRLNSDAAQGVCNPHSYLSPNRQTHIDRARFRLAAELWPS